MRGTAIVFSGYGLLYKLINTKSKIGYLHALLTTKLLHYCSLALQHVVKSFRVSSCFIVTIYKQIFY